MTELPDRSVFALLILGALIVTLVGVFVGYVKRLPAETLRVTHVNLLLWDGYSMELRTDPTPSSETGTTDPWGRRRSVDIVWGTELTRSCAGASQIAHTRKIPSRMVTVLNNIQSVAVVISSPCEF